MLVKQRIESVSTQGGRLDPGIHLTRPSKRLALPRREAAQPPEMRRVPNPICFAREERFSA